MDVVAGGHADAGSQCWPCWYARVRAGAETPDAEDAEAEAEVTAGRGAEAARESEFEVEPGPATALVVAAGPEVEPAPEQVFVPVSVPVPVPVPVLALVPVLVPALGLAPRPRPWLELRLRLASVLPRRPCEDDRVADQCHRVSWWMVCAVFWVWGLCLGLSPTYGAVRGLASQERQGQNHQDQEPGQHLER